LQKSKTIKEESVELKIKNKFQRAFSFGSADFQSQSENESDHKNIIIKMDELDESEDE
jgi:hypothetical protein